ncbi:Nramp family divalent metal transporter [Chitinophaga sp. XS-30]|uniref:Nramp family divalent metal transporter n=1 Tax=Chitinophaga sp. XS-30 TaxID=2604421 RepID=UPI0011DC79A8|nr:Nramp family divalent metal transporter [Chitinophaga sp. XS-30]QEH43387.1 divalent metal cation transporter [Chitinophaga sp. XS-30]
MIAKKEGWIARTLRPLGPGIITAALVFGPSKITITSKMGAEYGFSLIWIVVVAVFFMAVFTMLATRIGIASDQSLIGTVRKKMGKRTAVATGVAVFLVTASFQAGNAVGVGISLSELTGTPVKPWILICSLLSISLLFFRSFYKVLEKVMILMIVLMLTAFLTTMLMVEAGVAEIASGLTPSLPQGSEGLSIAFVASCFSIVGASYQAYLVQQRRRIDPAGAQKGRDSLFGILILGLMSVTVLVCAAAVLYPRGIAVTSATDMAKALEPVFGRYAFVLFLSGLFSASFSSLIGNASVGGIFLADALGYGSDFNAKPVRIFTAAIMVLGAAVAFIFGRLPIELLIIAQRITIFLVPFIGFAIFFIANDGQIMGRYRNSRLQNVLAILGLCLLTGLAIKSIADIFQY